MDFVGMDKMSLLDYEDKVSCVLFFNACNFACPYCHNGLTVLQSHEILPFEEVIDYLSKRKGIIDAVVFSGGEVTLMPDLKEKIEEIKSMGFLVKLDTNGTRPEVIKDLIDSGLVDYIAMDIKNSLDNYPLTTGYPKIEFSKEIKESIELLINSPVPYEFRTTLVKEFHKEEDMEKIGKLIAGCSKLYLQKFVERESCLVKGLHEVDIKEAEKFRDILGKYIDVVELRGY